MKISYRIARECAIACWQDAADSGKDFIDVVHTITKYPNNPQECQENFDRLRAFQYVHCIGHGFASLKYETYADQVAYANAALPFLDHWVGCSRECASDLVFSGTLIGLIAPRAGEIVHMDGSCTVCINWLKLLHHFLDGDKFFSKYVKGSDCEKIIQNLFVYVSLHRSNAELQTQFFSMLRDCVFGDHKDVVQRVFGEHRDDEWEYLVDTCQMWDFDAYEEKVKREHEKYRTASFSMMKEEANALLKLKLDLIVMKTSADVEPKRRRSSGSNGSDEADNSSNDSNEDDAFATYCPRKKIKEDNHD